jgi:hypothetical protein
MRATTTTTTTGALSRSAGAAAPSWLPLRSRGHSLPPRPRGPCCCAGLHPPSLRLTMTMVTTTVGTPTTTRPQRRPRHRYMRGDRRHARPGSSAKRPQVRTITPPLHSGASNVGVVVGGHRRGGRRLHMLGGRRRARAGVGRGPCRCGGGRRAAHGAAMAGGSSGHPPAAAGGAGAGAAVTRRSVCPGLGAVGAARPCGRRTHTPHATQDHKSISMTMGVVAMSVGAHGPACACGGGWACSGGRGAAAAARV